MTQDSIEIVKKSANLGEIGSFIADAIIERLDKYFDTQLHHETQSGRQFMTENKEAFEGLAGKRKALHVSELSEEQFNNIMNAEIPEHIVRKENKGKWIPIDCFHTFTPLFYVGHDGIIDNAEVYKYKGYIPKQLQWFLPLDEITYSDLME